jgi:hypothetical protein
LLFVHLETLDDKITQHIYEIVISSKIKSWSVF